MPDDDKDVPPGVAARLSEMSTQRQAALTQAATEKARADAATGRVTVLEAELKAWDGRSASMQEELGVVRAGLVDPEGITVARALHGALPAEGRLALPAWLTSVTAAPETMPKALAPYFAKADPAAAPKPGAPPPRATVPSTKAPDGGGAGEPTIEELKLARASLARGDPSAWNALKPRLGLTVAGPAK